MAHYRIGTSGWHYDDWRGIFYPLNLPKSKWLEFYAHQFDTVELNYSFYRLPSEDAFAAWRDASPKDFLFAIKVSRFITHVKKLKDCQEPVKTFLDRATILKDKLGPLLYQLPPNLHRNDERLESFLTILPKHLEHVIEFRHASWLEEEVFAILRRYNIGLCVFDMADFTCPLVATADFAYIRFHGPAGLYSSSYSDEELAVWAKRLGDLAPRLNTVYIYFNNDVAGYAIDNAKTMRDFLRKGG
ncbi:MAG: DUF72 domain-containing protein [Chloroflexi bacterium]|nr:DUF72 domain-containing protein [Chloroflexota bacterium]